MFTAKDELSINIMRQLALTETAINDFNQTDSKNAQLELLFQAISHFTQMLDSISQTYPAVTFNFEYGKKINAAGKDIINNEFQGRLWLISCNTDIKISVIPRCEKIPNALIKASVLQFIPNLLTALDNFFPVEVTPPSNGMSNHH